MKRMILIASLLVLALTIAPASAFTANELQVLVNEDGGADITFSYSLSWIEKIAVFFKIAEPEQELKSALEGATGATVTVTSAKSDLTSFSVQKFAGVQKADDGTTYVTPALDFSGAQEVLESYWFAALISVDLSPKLTSVRFPDGYEETFSNLKSIPALTHTVP